jgi:hypothetical protein
MIYVFHASGVGKRENTEPARKLVTKGLRPLFLSPIRREDRILSNYWLLSRQRPIPRARRSSRAVSA